MKNNIYSKSCVELGYPAPFKDEKQIDYIIRLLLLGFKIHTRITRAIGIYNLHSLIPYIRKRGLEFVLEHKVVQCPITKHIPPLPVDYIWMTSDQISCYQEGKRR